MICGFPKVEFDRLSNDEQLRICRNVYGEEDVVMESLDFVEDKLRELEKGIDALPDKTKRDYLEAVDQEIRQQTNYIRSKDFLLMFLRADSFNTRCAALRLARFLVIKRDLFGAEKLPRRITQIDLDGDDKKLLLTGFLNNDCGVDKAGRVVMVSRRDLLKASSLFEDKYVKSIQRALFYQYMLTLENNIGAQKNGIVIISWNVDCTLSLHDFRKFAPMKMMLQSLPYKFAGLHQCYNNAVEAIIASWRKSLSGKLEPRVINHEGSPTFCLSELSKYGIDVDSLPLNGITGEYEMGELVEKLEKHLSISDGVTEDSHRQLNPKGKNGKVEDMDVESKDERKPDMFENIAKAEKIPGKRTKDKTAYENKLPLKLMRVLNDDSVGGNKAIWWLPCGTAFAVDREKFIDLGKSASLISDELQGMKYGNFLRNLRRWGFRRLPDSNNRILKYHHPRFQKHCSSPDELLTTFTLSETQEMDNQSTTTRNKGGELPKILMKVLESNAYTDSIWWSHDGESFSLDTEQFSLDVLPTNFAGIKLESFLRTMRRWGFKKLRPAADQQSRSDNKKPSKDDKSTTSMSFHHPLFRRSSPGLVENWASVEVIGKPRETSEKGSSSKDNKLPIRLFQVLGRKSDDSQCQDAIWWLPGGKSFAIDTKKFSSSVLPREFEGIQWKSFRRSLCRWGFKRCASHARNAMAFEHPLFQKDAPKLLETMVGSKNSGNDDKDEDAATAEEAAVVSSDDGSDHLTTCQSVKSSTNSANYNRLINREQVDSIISAKVSHDSNIASIPRTDQPQNVGIMPSLSSQINAGFTSQEQPMQQQLLSALASSIAQVESAPVSVAGMFGLSSQQAHPGLLHLNSAQQSNIDIATGRALFSELQKISPISPTIAALDLQNNLLMQQQRACQNLLHSGGNTNYPGFGALGAQFPIQQPGVPSNLMALANQILAGRSQITLHETSTTTDDVATPGTSLVQLQNNLAQLQNNLAQLQNNVMPRPQAERDIVVDLLNELLKKQQGNANNC